MKKFLMAIFALAVATTVATAGVGINWTVEWGAFDHTESDLSGGSAALLDSYSAIWQLIYAGADNIINPIDLTDVAGGYTGGDDDVWAQRTIAMGGGTAPEDGTSWDNWMLNTGGTVVYEDLAWSTAGFVYQRVFEGTPSALSWYYDSPMQALVTGYLGGGAAPEFFALGDGAGATGFQPTSQIPAAVPEPATMGLLGLGALAMAIRRRRS